MIFIILAALCFAIGALIAFTPLNGISLAGLLFLGLLFLTLATLPMPAMPWRRKD